MLGPVPNVGSLDEYAEAGWTLVEEERVEYMRNTRLLVDGMAHTNALRYETAIPCAGEEAFTMYAWVRAQGTCVSIVPNWDGSEAQTHDLSEGFTWVKYSSEHATIRNETTIEVAVQDCGGDQLHGVERVVFTADDHWQPGGD